MNIEKLIKTGSATIIDVRTPGEYLTAHLDGAINIPLQDLSFKLKEVKQLKPPVLICCASGMRSGQAHGFLAAQGIECYNAGSWLDLKPFIEAEKQKV